MGRRKFRLSDMMPNSWFYKLRDTRRARGHPAPAGGVGASAMHASSSFSSSTSSSSLQAARVAGPPQPGTPRRRSVDALPHRASYYYPTRDREPTPSSPAAAPRQRAAKEDRVTALPRSPAARGSRRRHRVGPVSAGLGLEPVAEAPTDATQRRRDMYVDARRGGVDVADPRRRPAEDTLGVKVIASEKDIIIDLRAEDYTAEKVLRPIVTRPAAKRATADQYELKERHVVDHAATTLGASSASEQGSKGGSPRRSAVSTGHRLRTRANSPRLAVSRCRKGKPTTAPAPSPRKKTQEPPSLAPPLAESFAVVKASADPRRDFRESMEEMIAEKGIRHATDLEDLLACYLALNAAEYHDLIVEVFEQIWTSLASVVRP